MEKRRYGQDITLETRAEAHEKVDKKKRYAQIKKILKGCPSGLTAKEIAVLMASNGWIPNSDRNFAAPRLTEMCESGQVEPIGKKLCEFTGRKVTVYTLRNVVCDDLVGIEAGPDKWRSRS